MKYSSRLSVYIVLLAIICLKDTEVWGWGAVTAYPIWWEREKQADTEFRGHGSKLCVIICHICPLQCATSPTSHCSRAWESKGKTEQITESEWIRRQLSVKKQMSKVGDGIWDRRAALQNDSTRRDRKTGWLKTNLNSAEEPCKLSLMLQEREVLGM